MKLLYVDLKYDYGQKERGLNQIGQEGFLNSFRHLGFEVTEFYYDEDLKNLGELNAKLLRVANEVRPDIVFFILFQDQIFPETIETLSNKSLTINWFGDDSWRFSNFTSVYAPRLRCSLTTDKYSVPKYKRIHAPQVLETQWASHFFAESFNESPKYKRDISFIGQYHPFRKWFIDQLKKDGHSVECFGRGWDQGTLTLDEMKEIFQTSKINLNLSNSTEWDARYLLSHPKAFVYALKSSKNMSQIKARNFEINCAGGFQMTDYVPSLEDYLDIGKEVVCFRNVDECRLLVNYYLGNEPERERVRLKGYKKAKNEHTYFHRLKVVFDELEVKVAPIQSGPVDHLNSIE